MRSASEMSNRELLNLLIKRGDTMGSGMLSEAARGLLANLSDSTLDYRNTPENTVATGELLMGEPMPVTNGFSVEHKGLNISVAFEAVAPTEGGAQGYIPTPDDLVRVLGALNQANEQRQTSDLLSTYLFGFFGPSEAQTYAQRAMEKGPAEQRLQHLERQAAEFATTAREMVANVKAIGTSNVGNMTSLSERLAAVERHLGLRGSEGAAEVMMTAPPSDPAATAPPPSYEQVAAAERGEPRGGTVSRDEGWRDERTGLISGPLPDPTEPPGDEPR